jgi:hypothetical protein
MVRSNGARTGGDQQIKTLNHEGHEEHEETYPQIAQIPQIGNNP